MTTHERPVHIDLCSGIGGFSLAAQCAGFRTVAFCEINKFCHKILTQTWPAIPIESDIFKFDGTKYRGSHLLTAGFPCQPVSYSGKRRGAKDHRWLWPEVFRVIKESEPAFVLGENVDGLDGLGLDDCISDLESIGYEVAPPLEIPACAIGAIHPRNRIWIIAHLNRSREPQLQGSVRDERGWVDNSSEETGANLNKEGCDLRRGDRGPRQFQNDSQRHDQENKSSGNGWECVATSSPEATSDNAGIGWDSRHLLEASAEWRALLESGRRIGDGTFKGWGPTPEWFECEPGLGRLVHGIPNRTHRLKALGNSIVVQVAYQIVKEIRRLI